MYIETIKKTVIFMHHSYSVTGEIYCYPRRRLIVRFGERVTYHSKGIGEYIPK